MQKVLYEQTDFCNEKPLLQIVIEGAGHKCYFLPKFHCELNPIEIWNLLGLGKIVKIPWVGCFWILNYFDQGFRIFDVSQMALSRWPRPWFQSSRAFCQKCWRYMDAYKCVLSIILALQLEIQGHSLLHLEKVSMLDRLSLQWRNSDLTASLGRESWCDSRCSITLPNSLVRCSTSYQGGFPYRDTPVMEINGLQDP